MKAQPLGTREHDAYRPIGASSSLYSLSIVCREKLVPAFSYDAQVTGSPLYRFPSGVALAGCRAATCYRYAQAREDSSPENSVAADMASEGRKFNGQA
jgi:hypothetical protein